MTYLDISFYLFFFKHITTTSIDPLSLHDALPILNSAVTGELMSSPVIGMPRSPDSRVAMSMGIWPSNGTRRRFASRARSEEHTSELQSLRHLVCRLLLEKKNTN